MNTSNRERQALYRRRRRSAQEHVAKLATSLEAAIERVEKSISVELERGTLPNDGSQAGKALAEAQAWASQQRIDLDELKAEEPFFYVPGRRKVVARMNGTEVYSETFSGELAGHEAAHIEVTRRLAVVSGDIDGATAAAAEWTIEQG